MEFAIKWYQRLIRFGLIISPIVLLIVRLTWGWELFESGRGHLEHLDTTTKFFRSLNIPMPHINAIIAGTTEAVGGILIMSGFLTRLVSIPVLFNFCVAYATDAPGTVKHVFSDPDKVIDYAAFPFLILSLLMLAFGPGVISLDGLLKHTVFRKRKPPQLT